MVDAARAVDAEHARPAGTAAQQSEAQARARYDAGLAGIVEVAEAQNLLPPALSIRMRLARVDVWRALLAKACRAGLISALFHRSCFAPRECNSPCG